MENNDDKLAPPGYYPPEEPRGGQNLGSFVLAGQLATQSANKDAVTLNYGPIECVKAGGRFQPIGGGPYGTAPVFYMTVHDLMLSIPSRNVRQGLISVTGTSVLSGTGPVINPVTGALGDVNLATIYNEIQIVGVLGGAPILLACGNVGMLSQQFTFKEMSSNCVQYSMDESEVFDTVEVYSALHIGLGNDDNVTVVSMPINVSFRYWSK